MWPKFISLHEHGFLRVRYKLKTPLVQWHHLRHILSHCNLCNSVYFTYTLKTGWLKWRCRNA